MKANLKPHKLRFKNNFFKIEKRNTNNATMIYASNNEEYGNAGQVHAILLDNQMRRMFGYTKGSVQNNE